MSVLVKNPGLLTTVQDAGRHGFSHLGISSCGAADAAAFRIANLLLGNEENAAALEMTLLGATLEFEEAAVIAVTGANCDCRLNEGTAAMWEPMKVAAGEVLACAGMKTGARVYLAVQGGFDIPQVMGSDSTDLAAGFGGHSGRKLLKGDVLKVRKEHASPRRKSARTLPRKGRRFPAVALETLYPSGPIRVTEGAQQEWFGAEALEKLFSCAYAVSDDSDRSGLRLMGEAIRPRDSKQLLTDGIPLGAIQVPQSGQPIILFVDQHTTGGYPKIANVIAADMHRIGQLRPRDPVRFAEVTIGEAIELVRKQEEWLRRIFNS
jgi:antagonist of KipI